MDSFVHKPVLTHLTYDDHVPGFSKNLASLEAVEKCLDIEEDPYAISLQRALENATQGSTEWRKLDVRIYKKESSEKLMTFVYLCLDHGTIGEGKESDL